MAIVQTGQIVRRVVVLVTVLIVRQEVSIAIVRHVVTVLIVRQEVLTAIVRHVVTVLTARQEVLIVIVHRVAIVLTVQIVRVVTVPIVKFAPAAMMVQILALLRNKNLMM